MRRRTGAAGDPGSLLLQQLQRGVVPAPPPPVGQRDAGHALLAQLQRGPGGVKSSGSTAMPPQVCILGCRSDRSCMHTSTRNSPRNSPICKSKQTFLNYLKLILESSKLFMKNIYDVAVLGLRRRARLTCSDTSDAETDAKAVTAHDSMSSLTRGSALFAYASRALRLQCSASVEITSCAAGTPASTQRRQRGAGVSCATPAGRQWWCGWTAIW